jgi:hypothetical protein
LCRVNNNIDTKPLLLAPKWDTFIKHEGRKKTNKDLPQLGVKAGKWYTNKTCKHKKLGLIHCSNTYYCVMACRNPNFGLVTKARGCKVAGQEGDPGGISHVPRSAKSVKE